MPGRRLVPIIPKGMFGGVTRLLPALISPADFRLDLMPGPCDVLDSQYIPISALVVEDRGSGLVVRTRNGRLAFDLIEAFAEILNVVAANRFRILPALSHLPRVYIDRLVICRESWHFRPSDLEFSLCKAEADRYAAARRWGRRHNLPRFVFVKVPAEIKPFYVDFESPIYVEIFAKMIRREVEGGSSDGLVQITEMLPQ